MNSPDTPTNRHNLIGIDGGNPLGFLAALGTLRTLHLVKPDWHPKLAWFANNSWYPRLYINHPAARDQVIEALHSALKTAPGHSVLKLGDDIKFTPNEFRQACEDAAHSASPDQQEALRFLAALGSDAITNDKGLILDTALRTMSGASNQHFLLFMRTLTAETSEEQLEKSLYTTWQWDDPKPSMRWAPMDDRRHALRWKDPRVQTKGNEIKTVRGANRLAIEALPLLPTAVANQRLQTVGFSGTNSSNTFLTWPLWSVPLDCDSVRSTISLKALQEQRPDRARLASMGIGEVYRSQRITVDKRRNFTIAAPA